MKPTAAFGPVALLWVMNTSAPALAAEKTAAPGIFETDITRDLSIFSGEPEITIDPAHPANLAIIEMALGSSKVPAYAGEPFMVGADRLPDAMVNNNRIVLSNDGGNTRTIHPTPLIAPAMSPVSADPTIAYGPDGSLYVDAVFAPKQRASSPFDFSGYRSIIAVSRDGGKSFSAPQPVPMAPHRPFLKVDNRTGTVYLTTFGFDPGAKDQTDDSLQDVWVVAFKPDLSAHSEPHRFGGPDFSAGVGSLTAANGVVAATFTLGLPKLESADKTPPVPVPVPASLRSVIRDGTQVCSAQKPCIFFQTSSDEGLHWTRHQVPLPSDGYSGLVPFVAADPGRRGRYAVGLESLDGTKLNVLVTDDAGANWSGPHRIPESGIGKDFKGWMDYGPTGVLGFMWKKERVDPTLAAKSEGTGDAAWSPPELVGPAFDVYTAVSCDGGKTWLAPVRVNAQPSPPGPNRQDDLSYIALDAQSAHLVWGDRRSISTITNAPTGRGGVQAYYGRVPFSALAHGTTCGRR